MVKDIKYIIKRILIGVGIVLVLSFLRGNLLISAKALEPIYQGVHYYSNSDLVFNNNFPSSSSNIVDFNFNNNLNLPDNVNTTYLLNIPCSFSITYGSLQWYVGSDSSYATIKDISFQYYIVGNYGQRWIPGTFSNGMLQFYVPGGTQLHNLTIKFTTPGGINQTYNAYYSISLNSGITYYKLGSNQDIINNQNENIQQQIQNQNENTQQQIQNQNDNTKKQIESQSVCKNLSIKDATLDGFLSRDGNFYSQTGFNKTTNFITLNGINKITLLKKANTNKYLCFYDSSQVNINCFDTSTLSNNSDITIPSNASYFRVNFEVSNSLPVFSVCSNGNQSIVNSNEQLNNTLNDDTGGDVSSSWFDDFRSNSSTPVSDLLTMPITLMQAYLDGFSGNCQSMNLGKLYDTYIIIPCLNLQSYLGADLWSLIDVLFSMFMVYNIGMLCVTIYEGITGLQDDMQFLYSPRHAGAGDTRVERYGDDY